ncbi:MAG: hypothetical protein ACRD7E_14570 [Bryobacteraceae bacterium]
MLLRAQLQNVSGVSSEAIRAQIDCEGRLRNVETSHVVIAAGRTPNTRGIGLDNAVSNWMTGATSK